MAEILDNEVITAEILNDISVDLGYSELKFSENEKFGNDKLNAITGDLVSGGLLNILNKCECVVSGEQISVNTGVLVFADGAKKRITEINVLDILEGGKNYIYVKNDTSIGKIYLENSLPEPTGDCVLLAEYEDGALNDRRTFAKAKVLLPTEGNSYMEMFTIPYVEKEGHSQFFSFPVEGITKLIFQSNDSRNESLTVFDVEDGTFTGFYTYQMYDRTFYNKSTSFPLYNWNAQIIFHFRNITNGIATFEAVLSGRYPPEVNVNVYAFGGVEI